MENFKYTKKVFVKTFHSEYMDLIHSLSDFLPIKKFIGEVMENINLDKKIKFISKSTVYENNNGAIRVAICPRLAPTSKCIAVKYHWFWQPVENKEISAEKVDTQLQKADILPSPYKSEFVESRKLLCGS